MELSIVSKIPLWGMAKIRRNVGKTTIDFTAERE